jgi:hypothetical protein
MAAISPSSFGNMLLLSFAFVLFFMLLLSLRKENSLHK